eukprot:1338055-Alexandrium_andersonii.AAC.1
MPSGLEDARDDGVNGAGDAPTRGLSACVELQVAEGLGDRIGGTLQDSAPAVMEVDRQASRMGRREDGKAGPPEADERARKQSD